MPKSAYITARVEPALKRSAEAVLSKVGVSTTDAITMFLYQVVLHRGLPFEVRVPNEASLAALAELENDGGETFASFDEMVERLGPANRRG